MKYIFIVLSILIYIYLTNKDIFIEYYNNFDYIFINRMKTYLLWFYKQGYKDYKYLHYDANLLEFLYKNRHYEKISDLIYRNLVIKIINYLKLINKLKLDINNIHNLQNLNDKRIEILNVFHSFIFSIGDEDLTEFNNKNKELESLLNMDYKIDEIKNINIKELTNIQNDFYI